MSESEMAREASRYSGIDVKVCAAVLMGVALAVSNAWRRNRRIRLPGIGTIEPTFADPHWKVCNLPGQVGRRYRIPPRRSIRIRPAPCLQDKAYDSVGIPLPTSESAPSRGASFTFIP